MNTQTIKDFLRGTAKPNPVNVPDHTMIIMDITGHTTCTWNPDSPSSVQDARNEFHRLLRDGYQAFKLNVVMDNGVIVEEKGDRVTTFDPSLGKLIMFPHLKGG